MFHAIGMHHLHIKPEKGFTFTVADNIWKESNKHNMGLKIRFAIIPVVALFENNQETQCCPINWNASIGGHGFF